MDLTKCAALKSELSMKEEPQIVPIERFLDGNDDMASIGCNLDDHPGMTRFREVFAALRRRPDVRAGYAQIAELDLGPDYWPFTDTVLVMGSLTRGALVDAVEPLRADEVEELDPDQVPSAVKSEKAESVYVIWWD